MKSIAKKRSAATSATRSLFQLAPIAAGDFSHALDKPYIRAPQTWIGDAAFEALLDGAMA